MKMVASAAAAMVLALAAPVLAQTSSGSSAVRGSSGAKMSQAECTQLWDRLDNSKSGSITQSQAQGVVTDFNSIGKNGKLTRSQFMTACERGQVNASATTGSGSRALSGTGKDTGTTGQSTSPGSSTGSTSTGGGSK
jgi:hypothetical protein